MTPHVRTRVAAAALLRSRRVLGHALVLLALAACKRDGPSESYGFVATLGTDTVSVERVTRTPHLVTSDIVDRFPLVKRRHTTIDVADDGRLTGMVMRIRTPNGRTPAERGRTVTAEFRLDSVFITITDSAGVTRRNFRTNGALAVPHVEMMYSVIELEIASAMRLAAASGKARTDSMPFRQFYPDRSVGPSFVLHSGWVLPTAGDSVVLRHDWLSGRADVVMDSAGRMQSYSGQRSTYKVEVKRVRDIPVSTIDSIGVRFAAAEQQRGPSQLSVRDTARGTIGNATIAIDYGRPLARGRTLLGNVIAFDRVWRTGANAATQFTTSAPITIGGLAVPAGTYTLWTVPHSATDVDLIVNRQSGQWGTEYSAAQDRGTVKLSATRAATAVEKFTISVVPTRAGRGELVLEWGDFRWAGAVVAK